MTVIRQYGNNAPMYTIDGSNVIREYSSNAPVYIINGNTVQKYVGNIPVYTINGNVIQNYKDNSPVYTISGNIIQNYVGNTPVYLVSTDSGSSSGTGTTPTREEKPGLLGVIFKLIAFCVRLFKTWSGRVGMLLGVIAGIAMASQARDFMNALFIGIFAVLLLIFIGGGLGTLVGFIFRKSSKAGKFGGLIGAGVLALAGVILCLVEHMSVNNIIMFACFGLAVGWILGTIIGAIVGAIRKQIAKGKQSQ